MWQMDILMLIYRISWILSSQSTIWQKNSEWLIQLQSLCAWTFQCMRQQSLPRNYPYLNNRSVNHWLTWRLQKNFNNLTSFFDAIIVSGDVGWRKPSPRIFESALNALQLAPSEAVFVGDAPYHDIQGAKRMGMKTILMRKDSLEESVNIGDPDKRIREFKELPQALSGVWLFLGAYHLSKPVKLMFLHQAQQITNSL